MSVNTASLQGMVSASGSALTTVTQPVTDRSRRAYHGVRGGLEWYLEQWEDLVEETKAHRAGDARTTADIFASLPEARVVSDIPGRARLRLQKLKGNDRIAWQCAEALNAMPGISRAEVNPLTCSILMYYDTARYSSLEALTQAISKS
jgi:hypothetical protein